MRNFVKNDNDIDISNNNKNNMNNNINNNDIFLFYERTRRCYTQGRMETMESDPSEVIINMICVVIITICFLLT